MAYVFIGFGLVLLVIGSESVLRGGVELSKFLGLSPLVIGLLIVSAGTSTPELVVSLQAVLHDAPGLALGNVVGSNIVNLLLVLGFGALLRPIATSRKVVLRDGGMLIAATLVLIAFVETGTMTRLDGLALLVGFVAYVALAYVTDRKPPPQARAGEAVPGAGAREALLAAMNVVFLVFGLVCLYFGGGYVVNGGVAVAQMYHIPPAVIGLTVVALGSSMPELATTIVAAIRGHTALAIGNLIGSNIFNILLVLGVTASVRPFAVSPLVARGDIFVMATAAIARPLVLALRWRLTRPQGGGLVLSYFAYLGFVAWRMGYFPLALPGTS